jgi:carboxypeptidase C (cathepsin A)
VSYAVRAALLAGLGSLLLAVTPLPAASPEPPSAGQVPDAITHHTLALGAKTLAYTARAGTITLRNAGEKPTADIFYVAYTLDGAAPATRPVTFLYNGGPGSATLWLHMGSFGPARVEVANGTATRPAPYRVVPNTDTILDVTDLVFIDAPETGYSRITGAGKPADFFGVDKDVAAFEQFVVRYLTTFDRWNSPKFLYGESYGTTRSAALADALQINDNVAVNGIVLQSTILNYGIDSSVVGGNDWPYILYLPTETAAAWYHNALPPPAQNFDAAIAASERFAMGEYASALTQGSRLSPAESASIAQKLHQLTGLPEREIRDNNLRVPYYRFENRLFLNRGALVGRLDARFRAQAVDRLADVRPWDPASAAIAAPFTAAVNQYLRDDLGYRTALLYRPNAYAIINAYPDGWDPRHDGVQNTNVEPDLADAMTFNPYLKVFNASGYYDFATPFFEALYSLDHLPLDSSLRGNITLGFYRSGHMIYIEDAARRQLHDDLERWYARTLQAS